MWNAGDGSTRGLSHGGGERPAETSLPCGTGPAAVARAAATVERIERRVDTLPGARGSRAGTTGRAVSRAVAARPRVADVAARPAILAVSTQARAGPDAA